MTAETVVNFPTKLDLLAKQIKDDLALGKKANLDLCLHLAQAKAEFPETKAFGQWLEDNNIQLNHQDRAAAIAMGQEPERAREVFARTQRHSLQHIYENEFRVTRTSNSTSKRKSSTQEMQRAFDAIDRRTITGEDLSTKAIQEEAEVSRHTVERARKIKEAAAPPPPLPELSLTAQQKLEAWQRKLELEFEARVRQEAMKWVNEVRIPIYEKKLQEIEYMLTWPRNSVMTKAEYYKILMCLHPDALHGRTPEQLAEAFRIFTHYKLKMVDDKEERNKVLSDLPRTREEMLARKAQVKAERAARRQGAANVAPQ